MYATQSILAALLDRELTDGGGEYVDVSLFDSIVALQTYMASYYFATGDPPERLGSGHPTIVPYRAFPTADGYVVVACASENLWPKFCEALDRPDLVADDRFATNDDRVRNREELEAILEAEIADYDTDAITDCFQEHGVPANPVNDMADVFDHPQVAAREMRRSLSHPTAGEVEMPGSPMNFAGTGTTLERHPPALGEHTGEILRELGYDDDAIRRLREADAI
jgi:crotonobetainyl-CoA:carnitine CoA-transferase CaiB-like acyl-CoA transferase